MLVGTVGDRPGDKVSSNFAASASGSTAQQQEHEPRQLTKGELLAEERKRKEADRSEEGVSARIDEVVQSVEKDLKPQLDDFQHQLKSGTAAQTQTPTATATTTASAATPQATTTTGDSQSQSQPPRESPSQTHRVLNELFSRALLSLDAIPTVSDATRQKRKEAVRTVQAYIDQLDSAWDKRGNV